MHLQNLTLCCVDNQYPNLGFDALVQSTQICSFEEVIFFTSSKFTPPAHQIKNFKIISVDHICNLETYSEFMIKGLNQYISTNHVLIVQWDGFIINPNLWQKQFLEYDYIGAPWPTQEGLIVGNGGFSLRSKKLLEALQDSAIHAKHPEDQCICLENRQLLETQYSINFAPGTLAETFAFELQKPTFDCFGFHAVCNLPLVLNEAQLLVLINKLPEKLIFTEQFCQFISTCQKLNSSEIVNALIRKIMSLTRGMDKKVVASRQYRHIIKTCIRQNLYNVAIDTLITRVHVVGWNLDALNLLARIYSHKLLNQFFY